ncbi:MAG: ABC transporter permease subunit [Ignavibacteriaceae bacterium]|jgi:ABC-type transport system involved in multi-copper enzyme maturation permease subunit
MKNIWLMTLYTMRESISKKVFIAFSIFVLLMLVGVFFAASLGLGETLKQNPLGFDKMMILFKMGTANFVLSFGFLLSIFACASFIPSLLEKGTIDLFLSKPISRAQLLFGKYLGGLLIFFVHIFVLICGIWLIAGIKYGHWDLSFFPLLLSSLFYFAILNGVLLLFGVLTKSSGISMMLAYLLMFVSPLLANRQQIFLFLQGKETLKAIVDGFYYALPKLHEIQNIPKMLALHEGTIEPQILISSALFLMIVLYAGFYLFEKNDY